MNNSKKPKISNSFIYISVTFVILLIYVSHLFYIKTLPNNIITKVSSTDMISIDSLKRKAVSDTVKYFMQKVDMLTTELSSKDTLLNSKTVSISYLSKELDSTKNKANYYRDKYRELKPTMPVITK